MKTIALIIIILLFLTNPSFSSSQNNFKKDQLLCSKLLWGFEFISSNRVKVFETDLNKQTKTTEYFYNTDIDLDYINIFKSENTKRNRIYSIELNTLRVDVWTMTGGGFTTREMFPKGLCKFIKNDNIFSYIKSLKMSQ